MADQFRQRKEDQQRRDEKLLALFRRGAEASVESHISAFHGHPDDELNAAIETALLGIYRKIKEVREEIRRVEKDLQVRLNGRMKALTEALLESVEEGGDFDCLSGDREKKG
jgi:hypothetical protein